MDVCDFGKFICERRKEMHMTQDELGKKLAVTGKAISRWERGVGYPDISSLENLANALEVSVMELMQAKKNDANDESENEREMLNKTIEYMRRQRKVSKIKCILLSLVSFSTMVMGIILSTLFVNDLMFRTVFIMLLITSATLASNLLGELMRV